MLVSLENLFKLLYPPNLEHSNANERMDLFALYGPSVSYHSVDSCFCTPCSRFGKVLLEEVKERKLKEEKSKLGIDAKRPNMNTTSMSTTNKDQKVKIAPIRLLVEEDLIIIWNSLCEKCRSHCETYTHLCGGRNM